MLHLLTDDLERRTRMRRIASQALITICFLFGFSFFVFGAGQPLPEMTNSEKMEFDLCSFNDFRSDRCKTLVESICNKINYEHEECLFYRVARCHDGKKDRINSNDCYPSENVYCQFIKYRDRPKICEEHHMNACAADGFHTRTCLLLRQKVTIKKNEEQINENLKIHILGHETSDFMRHHLAEAIRGIDKQIDEIDDQLDNPLSHISPSYRKQLKKQKKELKKQRKELEPKLRDALALYEQCEQIYPIKFHGELQTASPNCDAKKDSLCPYGLSGF